MVDIIYNVLTRPLATEPDKKDAYHVDKAPKDEKLKRIEDDDPSNGRKKQEQEQQQQKDKQEQKGKGKYKDKDGNEHLDIFV